MVELALLVVVATSIWVFFDAPARGLSWTWGVGCLALWIVFFPWYLVSRSRVQQLPKDAGPPPPPPSEVPSGWHPDPRDPENLLRWREGSRWTNAIRRRTRKP